MVHAFDHHVPTGDGASDTEQLPASSSWPTTRRRTLISFLPRADLLRSGTSDRGKSPLGPGRRKIRQYRPGVSDDQPEPIAESFLQFRHPHAPPHAVLKQRGHNRRALDGGDSAAIEASRKASCPKPAVHRPRWAARPGSQWPETAAWTRSPAGCIPSLPRRTRHKPARPTGPRLRNSRRSAVTASSSSYSPSAA